MSQAELGEALGPPLGKPWQRQAVSVAEQGKRSFTAAELVAFAYVLELDPGELLVPFAETDTIDLPGMSIPAAALTQPRLMRFLLTPLFRDGAIRKLARRLSELAETAQETNRDIERAAKGLVALIEDVPPLSAADPEDLK